MQESVMQRMWDSAHLSGGNAAYVEELYELYLHDPNAVPEEWRTYFQKLPTDGSAATDVSHSTIRDHFVLLAKNQRRAQPVSAGSVSSEHEKKQVEVLRLIQAYRMRGHQAAQLDPLGLWKRPVPADLAINHYGLTDADLDTTFRTGGLFIGKEEATLREIRDALQQTYCRTIGAEFTHIVDSEQRSWFQQRLESVRGRPQFSVDVQSHLLERLTAAEGLEKSLGSKYPGTKRFGLEGGESLIPMLSEAIQRIGGLRRQGSGHRHGTPRPAQRASQYTREEPHRAISMNLRVAQPTRDSGDVKYHQGFLIQRDDAPAASFTWRLRSTHRTWRSFRRWSKDQCGPARTGAQTPLASTVVPIVIHGDAAFAGQGVVMETFQMSQTRGYKTGGTIHIVINNQVGFTTQQP